MADFQSTKIKDEDGVEIGLSNPLPVVTENINNEVSTVNSSTVPLTAGETFIGEWEDVLNFGSINVNIITDALSGNCYFQNSSDGVNIDRTFVHPLTDGSLFFAISPRSKYIRIVLTNTSITDQTFLRLQTINSEYERGSVYIPIGEILTDSSTAKTTRSIISGKVIGDGYANVDITPSVDGGYSLASAVVQKIYVDPNNSSTVNLDAGNSYTFNGTATTTLGVGAIQWNLKTDVNAMVYIEQSTDGINWDIVDSFQYYYINGGTGDTVQAVSSYWKIRVVLDSAIATTYFRLQGILAPIVSSLPRTLNNRGRLKTSSGIVNEETGIKAEVDVLGTLKTTTPVRLIGSSFNDTTKDTNFWTETIVGTGSVTQSGQITLSTGATSNSTIRYETNDRARKISGVVNQFRSISRLGTSPDVNNIRKAGAFDDNNGFFFQINGLLLEVVSRKGGVDTVVTTGNFNGNWGSVVTMDTNIKRLVIEYSSYYVNFFINDVLLHTLNNMTTTTNTLNLTIRFENNNINGNTTVNTMDVRMASIIRLGNLTANPKYRYLGTPGTYTLKNSAGVLQRVINLDNAGVVTIYDSITASGTLIAIIDTAKALGTLDFNAPYSNGLTIVVTTSKIAVIYE